ncbi:DUF4436 domain-containing protein [Mycobacterium sp. CBMA271]|uniref:DUF4436 family protein n=1 Tax=unclassified Mycobacteroides TaxID=2618759 RepID=UPI0012DCC3C8|nr:MULTISPECIES: DUF4436 family protein [unclassified Mycobacteroides]MUM16298.1 DUF4436 domain-containing protein [Mycobacteroides sp. CBMA 326]MUM22197.1 DUF4436 domain-containing protein [Mycobacteroides sp. CBMA 271]
MQVFKGRLRLKPAATIVGTVVLVLVIYVGFLVVYRMLNQSLPPSPDADLSRDNETVVVIDLQDLRTVNNRLDAEVVVLPADSLVDEDGLLSSDVAVRLVSSLDFGERHFARGTIPAATDDTLVAAGDAQIWPFDVYTTGHLRAEVLAGSGPARHRVPARIEVIGSLGGWKVARDMSTASDGHEETVVTLKRARGTLAFDVGICLVLITLPAMALFVAIETVRGVKRFHPPLTTWFGTMLFAIVPLRNILPGAPPPGAWIDQALVLWVLVALVVAMVLYVEAWWKQSD